MLKETASVRQETRCKVKKKKWDSHRLQEINAETCPFRPTHDSGATPKKSGAMVPEWNFMVNFAIMEEKEEQQKQAPPEEQETLNAMALSRIGYFNLAEIHRLYEACGSATAVIDHRHNLGDILPEPSQRLQKELEQIDAHLRRAEEELDYDRRHGISPLAIGDPRYPQRLRDCADAPLVVYYRGTADLNQAKIVSIVGTRHCTAYGQDLTRRFIAGLKACCPHVLIVSGLAYGIDICAHRNALQCGYETVAVLAHGLDDLYPPLHRATAGQMLTQGGLLTEYMTHTRADKVNFVRRNRIVAGCADATVLAESAARGGGLITCGIARSYGREVFAFPGAVGAEYSEGCNNLIRDNGAALITGAADFVKAMGWEDDARLAAAQKHGIERQLFPDLNADERLIADTLAKTNDLQINMLSVKTGLPISRLASMLFTLEMKGVVRTMAGATYHLVDG